MWACSGVLTLSGIYMYTVFILIEARCASAGISPSESCLFPEKTIVVTETPLTPYILQVCIVIYDLLKQVRTKCNIFNCKVKQFNDFVKGT